MPNLQRLLKRRPDMDEAEMEEFRARALARLSDLHDGGPAEASTDAPPDDGVRAEAAPGDELRAEAAPGDELRAEAARSENLEGEFAIGGAGREFQTTPPDDLTVNEAVLGLAAHEPAARAPDESSIGHAKASRSARVRVAAVVPPDLDDLPLASARRASGAATTIDLPANVADVMADLVPAGLDRAVKIVATSRRGRSVNPEGAPGRVAVAPAPMGNRPAAERAVKPGRAVNGSGTTRAKRARKVAAPIVTCPYCALLLLPPPTASRRCPRCRQRIVVKRAEGRTVYLAAAVLPIFDAEQQRIADAARWSRQRGRWLELASLAGARADHVARLEASPLTDATVTSARKLYMSTLDRDVKAARHDRRWGDASEVRQQQARVLFRLAGSPVPPPHEIVVLYREGASLALRDIGELARDAELVGANCCAACRADDGRIFRISRELRTPRLPHAECPKGLCRCQWSLAGRDRTILRRHRRRPPLAGPAATAAETGPAV